MELQLPEGIYRLGVAAPPPYVASVSAPPAATAIVIAGEVAELGSLYLVPPSIPAAAQYLCQTDEDCGEGNPCDGGTCYSGWVPAMAAPASLPLCPGSYDCNVGGFCSDGAGLDGICVEVGGGKYPVCLACGQGSCTADGIHVTPPSEKCP
jgi:hypothetical protein